MLRPLVLPKVQRRIALRPGAHNVIVPLRGMDRADGGTRDREGSDMLTEIFRSRTELRLETKKENFEFDAGGEREPSELLSRKNRNTRKRWLEGLVFFLLAEVGSHKL